MSPGEKLSFVWGRKLCFCCFDGRHLASQCRAGIVCGVAGCTAKHSKLLHKSPERSVMENSGEQQAKPNQGTGDQPIESHTLACSSLKRGQVKLALPIVPVKVRAKGQSVFHYTHALLNSGSTKTFCSEALIEKLDVKGKRANLSLTTVNSSESADVELVSLEVVAAKGGAGKTSVVQLLRDPELHAKYKGGIQELLDKGYAEKVPESEKSAKLGRTYLLYFPYHNVVNENKPEKLRIVFDCAVTFGGTSLNKDVLQGPGFTNNLVGVLLPFREEPVAVMGDIEGMFHQV